MGSSNQSARLNALQFAAKMHEILIVTSLSAIVLNCVQYELLYGRGVTLGSLLVGFQITDISSLWSPGLWATVFASGLKIRRFMLILLVVLAVVLGAVVGPASAILMLPSIDWWSYQPRLEGQCSKITTSKILDISSTQMSLLFGQTMLMRLHFRQIAPPWLSQSLLIVLLGVSLVSLPSSNSNIWPGY